MNKFVKFILDPSFRFSILASRGVFNSMSDAYFIKKKFKLAIGEELDLENPQTFNEKLQWLKLFYRKPIMTTMVDKYEAKKYISNIIGEEYIIPTLGVWDRVENIDWESLPEQFVLKCTHDSGGLVICKDKTKLDIKSAKKKLAKSLRSNYYYQNREWPYKNVKPRIIAEKYMSFPSKRIDLSAIKIIDTETLQSQYGLLDYKFMCFDGEMKAMFLDIGVVGDSDGHADNYYRSIFDRNWNVMPFNETREHYPIEIQKPGFFDEMVSIAEKLSAGFPHLRVDLYCIDGQIYVGELTFFHGSGMSNVFIPKEWNHIFGSWIKLP